MREVMLLRFGAAQHIGDGLGDILLPQDARPDGIVDIVVHVGDLVRPADDAPLGSVGLKAGGVA